MRQLDLQDPDAALSVLDDYGYRELRLPLLEQTELFARAIGEATDGRPNAQSGRPIPGAQYSQDGDGMELKTYRAATMAEALGRTPLASKYSPDMSLHPIFGDKDTREKHVECLLGPVDD